MTEEVPKYTLEEFGIEIKRSKVYCKGTDAFMVLLFILDARYEDAMARKLIKGRIWKDGKVVGKFRYRSRGRLEDTYEVWLKEELIKYLKEIKDKIEIFEAKDVIVKGEKFQEVWIVAIDKNVIGFVAYKPSLDYRFYDNLKEFIKKTIPLT